MVGDSVVLGIVSLFPILLPGISLGPRQYLFGDNSGGVKQVCVCVRACVRGDKVLRFINTFIITIKQQTN